MILNILPTSSLQLPIFLNSYGEIYNKFYFHNKIYILEHVIDFVKTQNIHYSETMYTYFIFEI